ncbi:MAG: sulfurtransferase TusA family protein [Pseudomonadota bacterium]
MPDDPSQLAEEIDARGLRCPLPVLRLEAVLRRVALGQQVKIVTDDPVAHVDIPHFCREGGHIVADATISSDRAEFVVTRGPSPAVNTANEA